MTFRTMLVTGGAGFIGANFVRYWHRQEPQTHLVILDALTYAGNKANLEGLLERSEITFVRGNICDRPLVSRLLHDYSIETIVHFAAESHVDRSILGPETFLQTNVMGTFSLLDAFKDHWQNQHKPDHFRFLHVSTDEVFGSLGPNDPAFCETTPYAPNSPYSASKAGSDHLVRAYHHTYGLPTLVTNSSNNYGPYQFPEKLIPLMCVNMLLGNPLPIYGDGQNIRDWVFVEDHCSAIATVLTQAQPGTAYNVGGITEMKNLDLVHLLCQLMDELAPRLPISPAQALITYVKDRPGHDRRYAMKISKIRSELGWQPQFSLQDGLRQTVTWYLNHTDWWMPLLSEEYQTYYRKIYGER
jgi:dTDP-glucose 4,6-dehydratase